MTSIPGNAEDAAPENVRRGDSCACVTLSASLEPAPQCLVLGHTPLWVVGLVMVGVSF